MSKLKCVKHDRRVVVVMARDGFGTKTIHREDGIACERREVVINGNLGEPIVRAWTDSLDVEHRRIDLGCHA